jgi:ADP-ribosyl-[dinitrogen reductase] hydrolase
MDELDRYRGCLLGLACGDAVGTTVEFRSRGQFALVTDMVGGGPFGLEAGQWTDDTSMALCLAESLLQCGGFDPQDQMDRYVRWMQEGYLSSTGRCFDIGNTVRAALHAYIRTGEPYAGSTDPYTAGNGSVMRLAPVPMRYARDLTQVEAFSAQSSRTTHGAQEAVDACRLFGVMLALALRGAPKETVLFESITHLPVDQPLAAAIARVGVGEYRGKPMREIRGTGYVVQSLEAALWCFYTTDDYRDAILRATNLGDDADTTAAICGQIAGAVYGINSIPGDWLSKLAQRDFIESTAGELYRAQAL